MKSSKPPIRMIVAEEECGYSGFSTVADKFIIAMGDTFDEFLENLVEAVNFAFEEDILQYTLGDITLISRR